MARGKFMERFLKKPLQPLAEGQRLAADAMDAGAPAAGMFGDALVDAALPATAETGRMLGSAASSMLSGLDAFVPGLGAAATGVGEFLSNAGPTAAEVAGSLANQGVKLGGRMAYGLGSGALRAASSAMTPGGTDPNFRSGLMQRGMMSVPPPKMSVPSQAPTTPTPTPTAGAGQVAGVGVGAPAQSDQWRNQMRSMLADSDRARAAQQALQKDQTASMVDDWGKEPNVQPGSYYRNKFRQPGYGDTESELRRRGRLRY